MFLHSSQGICVFAFFNQRVDDEGLLSFFNLAADEGIGTLTFAWIEDVGFNRLATRGHLINRRQVKIAINGQSEGARDRCGSHHQQVRIITLGT